MPNLLAAIKPEACAVGKIIVDDITYIRLRNGKWCYLTVWQDKVTRRIIGWGLRDSMTAELVVSALKRSLRKGLIKAGAIVHSDRGSQYASNEFRWLLEQNDFRQSMSATGNCYDMPRRKVSFRALRPRSSKMDSLKI